MLALLLTPIGILAVMNFYKGGYINFKAAAIMAIAFLAGSYFVSLFVIELKQEIIKKAFAAFLLLYSIKLFFKK